MNDPLPDPPPEQPPDVPPKKKVGRILSSVPVDVIVEDEKKKPDETAP